MQSATLSPAANDEATHTSETLLAFALKLHAAGHSPYPCEPGDKKPRAGLPWKHYQTRRITAAELRAAWQPGTTAFGLFCGKISGGLLAIDEDVHGALEPWRNAVGNLGEGLYEEITGSDKTHILFYTAEPPQNDKLAYEPDEAEEEGRKCSIETRGEGGFIVVAGSIHPETGRPYRTTKGSLFNIPNISQAHADALLAAARKLNHAPKTRQQIEVEAWQEIKATAAKNASRASRNDGSTESPIELFNKTVTIQQALERCGYTRGQRRYKRPRGTTAHEPTESVTIFENRFSYHHSSNDILNDKKAHDAFDIICTHEHGGDYSEAVKAVARELGIAHENKDNFDRNYLLIAGRGLQEGNHCQAIPTTATEGSKTAEAAEEPAPPRERRSDPDKLGPPIPLDSAQVPPLPDEAILGDIGSMITAVAAATETPPEMALCMALGVLSTACSRAFVVETDPGYSEELMLWMCAAMESGNRKTNVVNQMTNPLVEYEREQAAAVEPEIKRAESQIKTAEARISALRTQAAKAETAKYHELTLEIEELEKNTPPMPIVPRLLTQDVTPERTASMLAEQGERLAIISDEGGVFENMGGRYTNGVANLDIYLKGKDGSFVRVDRGSRPPVVLHRPCLTIAISPQPSVLAGLASDPCFRGRGLLARFLYMLPPSKLGFRTLSSSPVSPQIATAYRHIIRALLLVKTVNQGTPEEQPYLLKMEPDAYGLWKRHQLENEQLMRPEGKYFHIKDWASKLPGQTARIAACLHCAEHAVCGSPQSEPISAQTVCQAIVLAETFANHALAVFDIMGADAGLEIARKAWDWIARTKAEEFTARACWQPLRGSVKTMKDMDSGLAVLAETAHIYEVANDADSRNVGRPSRRFRVNPRISNTWTN